jgi:predicted tellurium resistance membrane protein TerC
MTLGLRYLFAFLVLLVGTKLGLDHLTTVKWGINWGLQFGFITGLLVGALLWMGR